MAGNNAAPRHRIVLFAGCRTPEELPFGDELRAAADAGELELTLASSRLPPPAPRVYVQQCIETAAPQIWEIIRAADTHVFVCGGTLMGRGVHTALLAIAMGQGALSMAEARDFFTDLKCAGRYVAELWGCDAARAHASTP